ncbi:MAG: T9SS type A sorting domain-containing protein [candidate division Zixibacteria bacterium]|nr:T9SS type A sorting domain-containing protein [candidate division Zixibacteria bacterium]
MRNSLTAFIVFCLLLACGAAVDAQIYDTLWTRSYFNGYWDTANCIQETPDHGFIMVGATWAEGESESDLNLIKTDSMGVVEWTTILGDSAVNEGGNHVLLTDDGGYLVSGQTEKWVFSGGLWVVKFNAAGDTVWTWPPDSTDYNGFCHHAVQTEDGGYAITGTNNISGYTFQAFLLRLDADGNLEWMHHYGDLSYQEGWFITEMPDSGFIVAGMDNTGFATLDDWWAFRTDKNGIMQWDSTYYMSDSYDEVRHACKVDDGIVLVGRVYAMGHVMKIDFDGQRVWSKSISKIQANESNRSICATPDGGFVVGGWLGVAGHNRDYHLIKLDEVGDTMWTYTVGGGDNDHGRYAIPTSDSGYAFIGMSTSFVNGSAMYLARIGEVPLDVPGDGTVGLPRDFELLQNYPNPFNPATTICFQTPVRAPVEVSVYDILGRRVVKLADRVMSAGRHTVQWDGDNATGTPVATGVYFYRVTVGDRVQSRSMLLLK